MYAFRRREQMTKDERHRGWVFFAVYVFIFPWLVGVIRYGIERIWAFTLGDAVANLIYHTIVTALMLLIFWTYLENAWHILRQGLAQNFLSLGAGLLLWAVLTFLVDLLPLPLADPMSAEYALEFARSPLITVIVYVFLMPIAEEILYRGLLFGTIKQRHRIAAYVITVLVFSIGSVWHIAISADDARYLLNALDYVPMALALCFCYDRGGSIYTPIVLHWFIHAFTLFGAI